MLLCGSPREKTTGRNVIPKFGFGQISGHLGSLGPPGFRAKFELIWGGGGGCGALGRKLPSHLGDLEYYNILIAGFWIYLFLLEDWKTSIEG